MFEVLERNWWALAIRGAIGLLFGLILGGLALFAPGIALHSLVLAFAAYMFADGIFAIVAGIRAAERHLRWWPLVLEGVADLVAAAIAVFWPLITLLVLVYLAAFWAILTGILLLVAAFHRGARHLLLGVVGALSAIWGVLILIWPIPAAIVMVWWIAAYAIAFGVMLLAFAFRLRAGRNRRLGSGPGARVFPSV